MTSRRNKTVQLLETVLDSMDEGFMAWSEDYTLVAWNQRFLDYWGYPNHIMWVGKPLLELLEYQAAQGTYGDVDPKEYARQHKDRVIADFHQSATGDKYERITKSPSGHWLRMRRRTVDGFGFVTMASDITEKYAAERAAELLHDNIDSFPESIIMVDTDGRVLFTNERYHEIYPASPPKDEIIGYTQEQLIRRTLDHGHVDHPLAKSDPEKWVKERLAERQIEGMSELESRHSNGRIYQIKQKRDKNTGSIIITTDVTEKVRAAEELQEAKDSLEERVEERTRELQEEVRLREIASRAKSEFLANMSHELRTPLNAVIGYSETILREVQGPLGNDKYLEYAKAINDAGEHLLGLINDVLDLSKVEAGQRDLLEEELALKDLFAWATNMVDELASSREQTLTSRLSSETEDVIIYGDERALRQMLLNLLSNAVKFTEPGGRIDLNAEYDSTSGLKISVKDNGRGIAKKDLEHILEPFSQAAPADSRDHEGTGLGLPLTKRLVELHGGTLEVESSLGQGTRVSLVIPPVRCLGVT